MFYLRQLNESKSLFDIIYYTFILTVVSRVYNVHSHIKQNISRPVMAQNFFYIPGHNFKSSVSQTSVCYITETVSF